MKFKTILTEAMIDTLPMSKFDKSVLKMLHTNLKGDETSEDLGSFLMGMAKKLAVDMHQMITLYMTYMKYKEFLFSEEGVEKVTSYDTLSPELKEMTRSVLMNYLHENYDDTTIYDDDGISANFTFTDDLDMMIEEEMLPETWVSMSVAGGYEDNHGNYSEDASFRGSVYMSVVPNDGKYGFDFISYEEETFGDWMQNVEGRKFSDQLDTGNIKSSYLKPLVNYSNEELKRFCDQWIGVIRRIVKKNAPLLGKYKDFVEHGGIFENKKKRKTIK